MKKHGPTLRKALLDHPEGLTVAQMSKMTGIQYECVSPTLNLIYGFYIADWVMSEKGKMLVALWRCVVVPESAPRRYSSDPANADTEMKRFEGRIKERNAQLDREIEASKRKYEAERLRLRAEAKALKEVAKTEREAAKAERLAAKEASKPRPAPAAPAGYKPQKTQWAFPPPWAH